MEHTLSHLPPEKRHELARAVELIRAGCPGVGAVLLFGSYARGDWREEGDLPPERRSGHDLLALEWVYCPQTTVHGVIAWQRAMTF